jgi:hypothetical protein
VLAVGAENPTLVATSCQAQYGQSAWAFMDKAVDRLRFFDTRWGYVCKHGNCQTPSEDAIAYHATAGPEVVGARGVWVIDIIASHCLANARADFQNMGFDPQGAWTNRGRF